MKFKPNQLVIKHLYAEGDTIPLYTIAKVVSIDINGDLELTSYRTPLDARYTDAYKWKPYFPHISRVKAIPCDPQ